MVNPGPPELAAVAAQDADEPVASGRLLDLILSTDPKQRLRIARSLLSTLVFIVCLGLIAYASNIGMMNPTAGKVLSALIVVSCTGFYVVLRSGLNLRFAEPALTLPQIMAALTWIAGAYAITNEFHGGTLMLVSLVLVFGVFNMNERRARISSFYAVAVMGGTMAYKSTTAPQYYPAHVEWVYFVFVATIVPTITMIASQLTRMRSRLKKQRAELSAALERIQELATRDELTGMINRRHMMQVLADHAALSKRSMVEFSIAIIDLDHFKRVNDTWGHGAGDEVLRGFAAQARKVLRETDVIARWGGEEFLMLMPEVPPGAPYVGIERLRASLGDFVIAPSVPELRIGFSAGITAYRSGESLEEAIERADKALYQAKAGGRNQSVTI